MGQQIPDTIPWHQSVPLRQKCQPTTSSALEGVEYGSKLSQSQLLAGLGNSFSVPVFQAIAENILKCFNGQKVNSDSEDSDSDSEGPPGLMIEPDQWEECRSSVPDKGSVDQFHTPVKKRKVHWEETIDEQAALERDAKYQRGFKHKACKPTPYKAYKPLSMMFGGVACQPWANTKKW